MKQKDRTELLKEIFDFLYSLGLCAGSAGFCYVSYALLLAVEEPDRLRRMEKNIYQETADRYKTGAKDVEWCITSAAAYIWKEKKPFLYRLAGTPLPQKPDNRVFMATLLSYFCENPAA